MGLLCWLRPRLCMAARRFDRLEAIGASTRRPPLARRSVRPALCIEGDWSDLVPPPGCC